MANLVYIESSRTARVIQRDPVSKNQIPNKETKAKTKLDHFLGLPFWLMYFP